MEKIILVSIGLLFYSGATFGQKTIIDIPMPNHLDKLKALPFYHDLLDPSNKWIIFDTDLHGTLNLNGTGNSGKPVQTKVFERKNNSISYFPDPSNMPVIDLSKNFSSNLHIKKFPDDYPSNMPELEVIMPEDRNILRRYNYNHMYSSLVYFYGMGGFERF
jgi:hypothetical protein